MSNDAQRYETQQEIVKLIDDFEDCVLPRANWNHTAHLTVAMWYLSTLPEIEATEHVITGIQRYNHATGIPTTRFGGYHETMTLFWIAVTRHFRAECNPEMSLLQRTNDFIKAFGVRGNLFRDYYTPERMFSWKARQTWVEPDLQPLMREHVRQSGGFVLV